MFSISKDKALKHFTLSENLKRVHFEKEPWRASSHGIIAKVVLFLLQVLSTVGLESMCYLYCILLYIRPIYKMLFCSHFTFLAR